MFFLGAERPISGHPYSSGCWQNLLFYWAEMMVTIPTVLYRSEVLRRAIDAGRGWGSLVNKSDPEKHRTSTVGDSFQPCAYTAGMLEHARRVVT